MCARDLRRNSPDDGNHRKLFSAYLRLFRKRNFTALWLGQLISFSGNYFNWLAIPITINRLTGSVTIVGLSFIINAIPALLSAVDPTRPEATPD